MNKELLLQAQTETERHCIYDDYIECIQGDLLTLKEVIGQLLDLEDIDLNNGYLMEFINYSTPYILI